MLRSPACAVAGCVLLSAPLVAQDHDHDHFGPPPEAATRAIAEVLRLEHNRDVVDQVRSSRPGTSGQGDLTFEVAARSDVLPQAVREPNPHDRRERPILACAHGGFAYDHRDGRGEVYWSLQSAGILRVERDRTQVELLDTDPAMRALNMHNATFFEHDGEARIAWAANTSGEVFVTDLAGEVLHTIGRPDAAEYAAGRAYAPTDTAHLDGKLWIADGYGSKHVMAYDLDAGAWTDTVSLFCQAWNPGDFAVLRQLTADRDDR